MTNNTTDLVAPKKRNLLKFLLVLIAFGAIFVLIRLYEKERPQISLLGDFSHVGLKKKIDLSLRDTKSGLKSLTITMVQGERQTIIVQKELPRRNNIFNPGPGNHHESITIQPGALKLKNGAAVLEISCRDYSWWNWMQGNQTTRQYPVNIDTKPPMITVVEAPRYIKAGGSGVVIYRINEEIRNHGVSINGHFNQGFSLEGPSNGRFVAYFGIPFDTTTISEAVITAHDQADNQGRASFGIILKKAPLKTDRINLGANFLNRKLPEFNQIYPDLTGSPLERYLIINNDVRKSNNEEIARITSTSSPERMWQGVFKQMARSIPRARFADHRTYYYEDREIDKQVHLGIDLASTRHADIKASNHGLVVFADFHGIYGNMVILDHGQGLFSLYAHLSQIAVAVGDRVRQDAILGSSGTSGMAGGDHLHFSMLINGVFITPLEWWDGLWLKLNVENPLRASGVT